MTRYRLDHKANKSQRLPTAPIKRCHMTLCQQRSHVNSLFYLADM